MQLAEVKGTGQENAWLRLPYKLYKDDPNWIAPLEKDIRGVFDPEQNPALRNGIARRWLLLDDKGEAIGRIAAFINYPLVEKMKYPAGGIGFFECIDNQQAANMLFEQGKQWLEQQGMKAMDGPINLGERDRFWGLLVEGFTPPSYMEPYNPTYYRQLFENYGFQLYFRQTTYLLREDTFEPTRLERIAQWVLRKPEHTFRHLETNRLEKYVNDFVTVYNEAWKNFENFKPVSQKDILKAFESMKPVIIGEYTWFAYVDGEPAGFIIIIPDVNQIFRHFKGKFGLWEKLKFLWYRRRGEMKRLKGLVFGIHPKYQNLGLDAGLVYHCYKEVSKDWRYKHVSISWIGGFNPKMNSLLKALNGETEKVHHTYRYMIDKSIPFEPYKIGTREEKAGQK